MGSAVLMNQHFRTYPLPKREIFNSDNEVEVRGEQPRQYWVSQPPPAAKLACRISTVFVHGDETVIPRLSLQPERQSGNQTSLYAANSNSPTTIPRFPFRNRHFPLQNSRRRTSSPRLTDTSCQTNGVIAKQSHRSYTCTRRQHDV